MVEFDLNKDNFIALVERSKTPAIVQLMAKVDSICTPLQLYATLQNANYSYLLESVERKKGMQDTLLWVLNQRSW